MVTHDDVLEVMAEEIDQLSLACKARAKPVFEAEYEDEDNISTYQLLDRWGDLQVPEDDLDTMDYRNPLSMKPMQN